MIFHSLIHLIPLSNISRSVGCLCPSTYLPYGALTLPLQWLLLPFHFQVCTSYWEPYFAIGSGVIPDFSSPDSHLFQHTLGALMT